MPDGTPYDVEEKSPSSSVPKGRALGARFLPSVTARKTGGFSDWRSYPGRNGKHNGEDWAAPEGTPVVVPDGIAESFVVKKAAKSDQGGNAVLLEGTMADGRTVQLQLSHLQDDSVPVKPGDTVKPGDLTGRVGNTGFTSDRSRGGKVTAWYKGKKSGHHLDIKVKIDGKYVDPATLG